MSSSQQRTINPALFRGFSRAPNSKDGLMNVEFPATCPPDVQPNTRIVAVCGVTDSKGWANPSRDGWFLSDFFLFHYLLAGICSNQIWLTACDPRSLVHKYKEYLHGPWKGDRRIVLDASTVQHHLNLDNFRIFNKDELLERFLATLRSEIEIADKLNQPVLILVFGHGDEGNHGIAIGGDYQLNAPRLTRAALRATLRDSVDTTLFITSCYSGGWVIKPQHRNLLTAPPSNKPWINISAITGAGPENESRSWGISLSLRRRAGGGMLATCALKALMATAEVSKDPTSLYISQLESNITEGPDGEDVTENPTYVALAKSVHDALKEVDPTFWADHEISFATQDDKWASEWRARSGFLLVNYRNKWEALKRAPANPQVWETPTSKEQMFRYGGGLSLRQQHGVVASKALAYLRSSPGDDRLGGNLAVHAQLTALVENSANFDAEELHYLSDIVDYRMALIDVATDIVKYMDLNFANGVGYDTLKWIEHHSQSTMSLSVNSPQKPSLSQRKLDLYRKVLDYIRNIRLFDPPTREQGPGYTKPKEYVAIAIAEAGISFEDAQKRLNEVKIVYNVGQLYAAKFTPKVEAALRTSRVRVAKDNFNNTFRRIGQRLRSLSPTKGVRKPLNC